MTDRATIEKQEEKMVHLVRNALLVAGQEMGNGDQWPVIKSTIYSLMKDFEDLKIERNAHDEMKKHVYAHLAEMDRILVTCSEADRIDAEPKIKQLREVYDAYFQPVEHDMPTLDDEETPDHIKRAEHLLKTLEENHEA